MYALWDKITQRHTAYHIDAHTLQPDHSTDLDGKFPTKYNIKGVGVVGEYDVPQAASIDIIGGKLVISSNSYFLATGYLPVSPRGGSSVCMAMTSADTAEGMRATFALYDNERNLIQPSSQYDTAHATWQWNVSSLGAKFFYLTLAGGADPELGRAAGQDVLECFSDGALMTEGSSAAALNDHEWFYDETANPDETFSTLYIRDDSATTAPNDAGQVIEFLHNRPAPVTAFSVNQDYIEITTLWPHKAVDGDRIFWVGVDLGGSIDQDNRSIATIIDEYTLRVSGDRYGSDPWVAGTGWAGVLQLLEETDGEKWAVVQVFDSNRHEGAVQEWERRACYARAWIKGGQSAGTHFQEH